MWVIVKIAFHWSYLASRKNLALSRPIWPERVKRLEVGRSGLSHPSGTTLVLFDPFLIIRCGVKDMVWITGTSR
jgi:hypothetical protein